MPAVIQKLHGNPSHRVIPDEPEGVDELWAAPPWFDDEQREAWRFAVDHAPVGLLSGTDRDVMIVWVVATVEHRRAALEVAKLGQVVQRADKTVGINPYLRVMNAQAAIILRTCQEIGFSPAARAHLGARAPAGGGPLLNGELAAYLDEKPDKLN
ncbi:MAG TPA: P27 family phage terminase small subunit [Reyranella sp.]|nr:P27 family phage terminase small subunit [Reyranella sp.]